MTDTDATTLTIALAADIAGTDVRAGAGGGRELTGVAVPWDRVATLAGGRRERFARGSVRGRLPLPLRIGHPLSRDHASVSTPLPIGVIERLSDDADGLRIHARLLDVEEARHVAAAHDAGLRTGLSVEMTHVRSDSIDGVDVIRSARLVGVGVGVAPVYRDAVVEDVRARTWAPRGDERAAAWARWIAAAAVSSAT